MTNGNERLDRIESILEQVARSQGELTKSQAQFQEQAAKRDEQVSKRLDQVSKRLDEMAARQQYHDEAFERHDAQMKVILEAIAADGEHIRTLARKEELHYRRLKGLEGGEAV